MRSFTATHSMQFSDWDLTVPCNDARCWRRVDQDRWKRRICACVCMHTHAGIQCILLNEHAASLGPSTGLPHAINATSALIDGLSCAFTYSFPHLLALSLTHSLTHWLTHSLTNTPTSTRARPHPLHTTRTPSTIASSLIP